MDTLRQARGLRLYSGAAARWRHSRTMHPSRSPPRPASAAALKSSTALP